MRTALTGQVPTIIEAYVGALYQQALERIDPQAVGAALRRIEEDIQVEHLPHREAFQQSFLAKRAHPPEIKVDETTDRVYLVGIGVPGREELKVRHLNVRDKNTGDKVGTELVTESVVADDTVISYTELSWTEYRRAEDEAKGLDEAERIGLCRYFNLPPTAVVAAIAATPSLTREERRRIASYALDPRTGFGQDSGLY